LKRLVIDASTLVSGIVGPRSESPPCLIYDAVSEMSVEAIICPRLLGEVERALRKPYFRERIEDEEIAEAVSILRDAGTLVDDPIDPPAVLRDPTDDYLVMLARESDAEAIVTSDHDLLDHGSLSPPAIDPRTACKLLALIGD
jgi:putative PIN family toxin of toxin-antitoxin system